MSSSIEPEYRLRNFKRSLTDLLMSRRLSADPEATGVVELGDFGKKCRTLAEFAAESAQGMTGAGARIAEELELAAGISARLEETPRNKARINRQCELLEDVSRMIDAALAVELDLQEEDISYGLGSLAQAERANFELLMEFEGKMRTPPPRKIPFGPIRRALRRALLDHEEGPFHLTVTKQGVLEFGDQAYDPGGAPVAKGLPRSVNEPAATKQALDLFAASDDEGLKDFLLCKAIDAALQAHVVPQLGSHAWINRARMLPKGAGKRAGVRPDKVRMPIEGWDEAEAARAADRLAAKRAGPEWARIPKAAYPMRLFGMEDDELTADILALGGPLKAMEKGEAVEGVRPVAERVWAKVAGLL